MGPKIVIPIPKRNGLKFQSDSHTVVLGSALEDWNPKIGGEIPINMRR